MTSRYSIPGYYLMLEGSPTSASNLEWFVTNFFEADKDLLETAGGGSAFDLCNELVATTEEDGVGDSGITFLPYLYGRPVSIDAKACFMGLDGSHTRADLLRAIYEGVVFGHRWHVENLLRFRSMPEAIRLTGGACKSDVWMQIFADVFQTAVEVPAGTELGALGASICGRRPRPDCTNRTRRGVRGDGPDRPAIRAESENAAVYQEKYARFKRTVELLNSFS